MGSATLTNVVGKIGERLQRKRRASTHARGEVSAAARIVHRGRTIAVGTCEIVNAAGKTVAMASGSVLILPGRPWDRRVSVQDEMASTGPACFL